MMTRRRCFGTLRFLGFVMSVRLVSGAGAVAAAADLPATLPRVVAADFGFSPQAEAAKNVAALQKALDGGRKTVAVTEPGVYDLDATVWLDDDTRLECSPGVVFRKAARYSFVLANRGMKTREWNERIAIHGLEIACNGNVGLPAVSDPAFGMRGLVSLFRVKGASVTAFRCVDLETPHFCLHFCAFEDLLVDGFEIRGNKDGVHLGPGKGFVIRNGVCQTGDDALALNAQDYPSANPTQGDIVDGLVENVTDEPRPPGLPHPGSLSRLLTGAWIEWHPGIRLQNGDTVRRGEHVYRILANVDTTQHESNTPPEHTAGPWKSPEGLTFVHNTSDGVLQANIRNVVFRGIRSLSRNGFNANWEDHKYHRAVHPEVKPDGLPVCEVTFENCTSESAGRPRFIGHNSNLTATLRNVTATGPLVILSSAVHPIRAEVTLEECRFEPDDRPANMPDIALSGTVSGKVFLKGTIEARPMRLVLPEGVTTSKSAE